MIRMHCIPRQTVECEGCHPQLPSKRKSWSGARRTYWRSVASSKWDTSILVAWRKGCPLPTLKICWTFPYLRMEKELSNVSSAFCRYCIWATANLCINFYWCAKSKDAQRRIWRLSSFRRLYPTWRRRENESSTPLTIGGPEATLILISPRKCDWSRTSVETMTV